jgi:pre-rRNA-processing protein TSR3
MASSGSTRSRSAERSIRLYLWLAGEDHPKVCTGRKLVRAGWAREVGGGDRRSGAPILLDPRAPTPLSSADAARARRDGVLGIDCSWNRLAERGGFPPPTPVGNGPSAHRRLPLLVPTNPQHYGRTTELTTAEAFAAALYLLGEESRARRLLDAFPGGAAFFDVNAVALHRYREAATGDELLAAERGLFGGEPVNPPS